MFALSTHHHAAPPPLALDEATIERALADHTTRPHALDRLQTSVAVLQRPQQAARALVIVSLDDTPLIISADLARRLAVHQDSRGRQGAAHDLMAAADCAEAMAARLQGSIH